MLSTQQLAGENVVVCPRCRSSVTPNPVANPTLWRCAGANCRFAAEPFPVVAGLPILVDFDDSVLQPATVTASGSAPGVRHSRLPQALQSLIHPTNTTATSQLARMVTDLRAESTSMGRRPRILVVGGGSVGNGLSGLYSDSSVDLISFDIYASPHVQFVGDGHAMALADNSVDGVVVQAVLEHVLEPSRVVAEIWRVLRPGGIVYADTPFLQHVHEGPYDFTRFTDSGHRYLFRQFELIDSGTVAGAGTVLRWSIDYFVRALTRSRKLGRVAGMCFFWLSSLDRLLDRRHSLDGASSVFFVGRKTSQQVTPAEIIAYYQGGGITDDAQHR